jgi:hypothetical protein
MRSFQCPGMYLGRRGKREMSVEVVDSATGILS